MLRFLILPLSRKERGLELRLALLRTSHYNSGEQETTCCDAAGRDSECPFWNTDAKSVSDSLKRLYWGHSTPCVPRAKARSSNGCCPCLPSAPKAIALRLAKHLDPAAPVVIPAARELVP